MLIYFIVSLPFPKIKCVYKRALAAFYLALPTTRTKTETIAAWRKKYELNFRSHFQFQSTNV